MCPTAEPRLRPIEPHIRAEASPDDAVLVIRGGPLTVEKLVEHALREEGRYSYRGVPMPSVSVEATVAGWTLESILSERLWSRTSYAIAAAEAIRRAGYELLPTFEVPHYDVLLPAATHEAAGTLLSLFGEAHRNEHRRRRR